MHAAVLECRLGVVRKLMSCHVCAVLLESRVGVVGELMGAVLARRLGRRRPESGHLRPRRAQPTVSSRGICRHMYLVGSLMR